MLPAWTFLLAILAAPPPGESAPAGGLTQADARLLAALRLKEERKLEEARYQLESLVAASSVPVPEPPGGGAVRPGGGGSPFGALTVLAELEAVDVRMRLGRLEGVDARLRKLREAWAGNEEIRRRVRAFEGLLSLRGRYLLEPNAITRADLGERFRQRFCPKNREEPQQVPLNYPIRYLSNLAPVPASPPAPNAPRQRAVTMVGFLSIDDLHDPQRSNWKPALDFFDLGPRALVALFVYTGDLDPPPPAAAAEPWTSVAIFWIRGTPAALASAPVRSRYEWLPGPTFFLLDPGGQVRSWHWPHEDWLGYLTDARTSIREAH